MTEASRIPHGWEYARATVLDKEASGYEVGDDVVGGGGDANGGEPRSSLG